MLIMYLQSISYWPRKIRNKMLIIVFVTGFAVAFASTKTTDYVKRESDVKSKAAALETLYSPRARRCLFMFLSPKGLIVFSRPKFSQESEYERLTKQMVSVFSQFDFE